MKYFQFTENDEKWKTSFLSQNCQYTQLTLCIVVVKIRNYEDTETYLEQRETLENWAAKLSCQ